MAKLILGLLVGLAISALYIPAFVIAKSRTRFLEGREKGMAEGRFQAAEAIGKEFGHYKGESPYQVLLSATGRVESFSGTMVTTSSVVRVEINGVKTVRVIP